MDIKGFIFQIKDKCVHFKHIKKINNKQTKKFEIGIKLMATFKKEWLNSSYLNVSAMAYENN